jgi:DnaK suppressor protein
MPKKKAASKKTTPKRTATGSSSKRAVARVSKKKSSSKSASRSGKHPAKRKDIGKKVTRKKSAAKKSPATKSSKKTSAKRTTSSKKTTRALTASRSNRPAASAKSASALRPSRTTRPPARHGGVLAGPVPGFEPYQPKRGEAYMSEDQLDHFRQILLAWKRELMEEVDRTMHHMKDDASNPPDPNDRATQETEFGLELRTRDRERKLLKKIESALDRIDNGAYGYCEETGDEIGLRRLEARPVATLCVEAQERRELAERQFTDREDYYR